MNFVIIIFQLVVMILCIDSMIICKKADAPDGMMKMMTGIVLVFITIIYLAGGG